MQTHTGKIMAIGAHADDIELMYGGTLLKARALGLEVIYIMSTNNMSGRNNILQPDGSIIHKSESAPDMMRRRKRECADAARLLDATPIHLDHPQRHFYSADGAFHELRYGGGAPDGIPGGAPSILTAHEDPPSVRRLTALILEHNPVCILTHTQSSMDLEHVATALLVIKAFRAAAAAGFQGAYLYTPDDRAPLDNPAMIAQRQFRGLPPTTPAWDDFFGEPNARWETFVDITKFLDGKIELIGKHHCQMPTAHYPDYPARVRALQWGAACGCRAAETFHWMRRRDFPAGQHPLLEELAANTYKG